MTKRVTLMDEHLNQVVWHGGFPVRRGDVLHHLSEIARSWDKNNWLRIRDAGMLGNYQYNKHHGYPPEGTIPLTLDQLRQITGD